jgi:hypothetical protein
MSRCISALFALILVISSSSAVFAQEAPVAEPEAVVGDTPLTCSDWYTFGSVRADIKASKAEALPGETLTFEGTVANANTYPFVDGTLYVKIFSRNDDAFLAGFGNNVVDQFVVEDDIRLAAQGSHQTSFTWKVPNNAVGGEYYVAYFFSTADRYHLMGLPYSDEVIGNRTEFAVTQNNNETVTFAKEQTVINGESYSFAGDAPEIDITEPTVITTAITNPTDVPKTLPLQWTQYAWDASSKDNLRNTKTEVITLAPNETKTFAYTVMTQRESAVYVSATTQDGESKSILNVYYTQAGTQDARITMPGVSAFPLKAGEASTLFACARAANGVTIEGATLTLTLKDSAGNGIHTYTYQGNIEDTEGAYGEAFTPAQTYNFAVLTATIEKDGAVLETMSTTYDCNRIDPSSCQSNAVGATWFDALSKHLTTLLLVIGGLILVLIAVVMWKKRNRHEDHIIVGTPPLAVLLLLVCAMGIGLISPTLSTAMYNYEVLDGGGDMGGSDVPPPTTINGDTDLPPSGSTSGVPTGQPSDPTQCPNVSTVAVWQSLNGYNDWSMFTGPGNAKGNRLINNCPINAPVGSEIRDDNDGTRAITEDNYKAGGSQLCLGTSDSGIDIVSGWVEGSCPLGSIDMGVYDSDDSNYSNPDGKRYYHKHDFNEEDNTSNDLRWCLGVTSPGDKYEVSSRKVPGVGSCATDEAYLFYSDNDRWNMNNEDNPTRTSLCVKVAPKAGATCGVPYPTADITINGVQGPITVAPGTPITIAWSTTDATSCSASSAPASSFTGEKGTSGSEAHTFGSAATTYSVTCSNASGNVTDSITVNVSAPPSVNLAVNGSDGPLTIGKNSPLSLTWTTANVSSCTLYGAGLPGGAVAVNGTASISASAITSSPESYVLSCDGIVDSVAVTAVNQAPSAPTITGPTSAGGGVGNTFTITGADPDNDQIYYQIDWDNNGTVDVNSPGSGYLNSGTGVTANRSWFAAGPYTFQARTVDIINAPSGWTQHTITITSSVPATASLEVSVNGGGWTTTDQTINPGDSVSVRWSSSNATSCSGSGSGLDTGNSTSGTDGVNTPAPNSSDTFTVTCSGPGGSSGDSVTITSRQAPNFTTPLISFNPAGFNTVTGTYDSMQVIFQTSNNGGSDTTVAANYQFQFDRGSNGYDVNTSGSLGTLNVSASINRTETVSGVPLGNNRIQVTVDSTNAVTEVNEGDNVNTLDIVIPPPNPGLNITANRTQVRSGETVTLTWTAGVAYPLNCRVFGPGVNVNPSGTSGTQASQPITAKSEFTFECIEPITGTVFKDTVIVEAQGVIEEI